MTASCTLFSDTVGLAQILAAARSAAPDAHLEVEGDPGSWQRLRLSTTGASLCLTSMVAKEPGDEFSKLLLGLHNHFRRAAIAHGRATPEALKRVLALGLAVGIVAEPTMECEPWVERVVWAAAEAVSGSIFNGNDLLTSEGTVALPGYEAK